MNSIGLYVTAVISEMGRLGIFLIRSIAGLMRLPVMFHQILHQINFIGSRSSLIIVLAGIFTGMVLSLQFFDTLVRFGTVEMLGSAVGLSLVRELGPVLTALMATGRTGSAICAELGIMRTTEQIDALECMGIDPYRFLVSPKLVAGILSLPVLTILFDLSGVVGGYFVGVGLLGVGHGVFFQGLMNGLEWSDLNMGLIKSVLFGILIIWICSAKGFLLHCYPEGRMGAEGVSRVTTRAVVISSIMILFGDFLIGSFMI